MSHEQISYPPLDPAIEQQFAAEHTLAVKNIVAMHDTAGTAPLPEGQWSTPVYQSFSNNNVLGQTPLQNGSASEDMAERGFRRDANGQYEKIIKAGTKIVGDQEYSRILSIKNLSLDETAAELLVKTADLDAAMATKRAETSARRLQKSQSLGVTALKKMSLAGAESAAAAAKIMNNDEGGYDPSFHQVQSRSAVLKDYQASMAPQQAPYDKPRRYTPSQNK